MKGKNSRRALKGQSFLEAILTGFLIALGASLIVQYFGVNVSFPPLAGIVLSGAILANFILLFLIGVPTKLNGTLIILIIILILGYAAYGPYSEYLRGPMSDIGESMRTAPGMAEQQLHCLSLLMTDPMSYQTECVVKEQPKAKEEKPENYGFEIIDFKTSTHDIYAGMLIQIQTNFENKGDYDAEDVLIEPTAGKYRECGTEVLDITGDPYENPEKIRPEETYNFRFKGKINDPWDEDVDCTYAKNKPSIGGKIELKYSYDYQTEAYIDDLRAIKNTTEVDPRFEVKAAKEKAAPGNILMYTFSPLIWDEESFRDSTIPISFKNERSKGTVKFRGRTEEHTTEVEGGWAEGANIEKWCTKTCEEISKDIPESGCHGSNISDCTDDAHLIEEEYLYCKVKPIGQKLKNVELDFCEKMIVGFTYSEEKGWTGCKGGETLGLREKACKDSDDGLPIYEFSGTDAFFEACLNDSTDVPINADLAEDCDSAYAVPVYDVKGGYGRGKVDKITVYIVGDDGEEYVDLSCGGGSDDDLVECSPIGEDKVELILKKEKHELEPGEDKFLYSGVLISLVKSPFDENIKEISFGVKADATYLAGMKESEELTIYNPHYTD